MNPVERTLAAARAAELTTAAREGVTAALALPEGEREALLVDALDHAVAANEALTALLIATYEEKK